MAACAMSAKQILSRPPFGPHSGQHLIRMRLLVAGHFALLSLLPWLG